MRADEKAIPVHDTRTKCWSVWLVFYKSNSGSDSWLLSQILIHLLQPHPHNCLHPLFSPHPPLQKFSAPVLDRSNAVGLACRRYSAPGAYLRTSDASCWPFMPSHSPSRPSISRSQLWRAQHVLKILSATSMPSNRIPVFNIRHRPFSMSKVHSTLFRNYSSHWLHLLSSSKLVNLNGGTVVDHLRYPLSAINHGPWYNALWITPVQASFSKSSNVNSGTTVPVKIGYRHWVR